MKEKMKEQIKDFLSQFNFSINFSSIDFSVSKDTITFGIILLGMICGSIVGFRDIVNESQRQIESKKVELEKQEQHQQKIIQNLQTYFEQDLEQQVDEYYQSYVNREKDLTLTYNISRYGAVKEQISGYLDTNYGDSRYWSRNEKQKIKKIQDKLSKLKNVYNLSIKDNDKEERTEQAPCYPPILLDEYSFYDETYGADRCRQGVIHTLSEDSLKDYDNKNISIMEKPQNLTITSLDSIIQYLDQELAKQE